MQLIDDASQGPTAKGLLPLDWEQREQQFQTLVDWLPQLAWFSAVGMDTIADHDLIGLSWEPSFGSAFQVM